MTEDGRTVVANSALFFKEKSLFGHQTYRQYLFQFIKPPATGGCYTLQYGHHKTMKPELKLENVLSVDKRQAKSQAHSFVIHCTDRKFQFACSSDRDLERWLDTLRQELISKPLVATPGEGTIGVEIDATSLSRHLQLNGLYLFEVTSEYFILWLPRSRKEAIRWPLACIHSIFQLKPRGAEVHCISIELNEESATGTGRLIFKTDDSSHIAELFERYTGKKIRDAKDSIANGKSMRSRGVSQDTMRITTDRPQRPLAQEVFGARSRTHVDDHKDPSPQRQRSQSTINGDQNQMPPALPARNLKMESPTPQLVPVVLDKFGFGGGGHGTPPTLHMTPARQRLNGDLSRPLPESPSVDRMDSPLFGNRSSPVPGISTSPGLFAHHAESPRGGSPELRARSSSSGSGLLSPDLLSTSPPSVAASPLFPARHLSQPVLPPRPSPVTSPSRGPLPMAPAVPPRPNESLDLRGASLTMPHGSLPPPVRPRGLNTLPAGLQGSRTLTLDHERRFS